MPITPSMARPLKLSMTSLRADIFFYLSANPALKLCRPQDGAKKLFSNYTTFPGKIEERRPNILGSSPDAGAAASLAAATTAGVKKLRKPVPEFQQQQLIS